MKKLKSVEGFPKIVASGFLQKGEHQYIVMAKLGPNLKEVVNWFRKKRFTLKTVIQIGL